MHVEICGGGLQTDTPVDSKPDGEIRWAKDAKDR